MAQAEPHVLDKIGSGGLSTVYRAEFEGKIVTLKVPFQATANFDGAAFDKTMSGLAAVGAANVSQYRVVQYSDTPCWVSEHHAGVDFVPLLATAAIPRKASLEAIAQVARTLAPVAATGLLHGDLKPSNLLVQRDGTIVVLDFGLSLLSAGAEVDENATAFYGSLGYMAPERLEGGGGTASDVYGLAAVLYEMLVRERPAKASANPKRHADILERRVKSIRAVLGEDAEPLVGLLESSMTFKPDDRPTMAAFADKAFELAAGATGDDLALWAESTVVTHLSDNESFPLRNDTVEVARDSVAPVARNAAPTSAGWGWVPAVLLGTAAAVFVAILVMALT